MSGEETTEILENKYKRNEKDNYSVINDNLLIKTEEMSKEHQISYEEMLKQKLTPLKKSKITNNNLKLNGNLSLSINPNSKDLSISLINLNSKQIENKKVRKHFRFNDELGKDLIEFIDIECIKDFNIEMESESQKSYHCKCSNCAIF